MTHESNTLGTHSDADFLMTGSDTRNDATDKQADRRGFSLDPDPARAVDSRPTLPESIRAAILATVQAAAGYERSESSLILRGIRGLAAVSVPAQ